MGCNCNNQTTNYNICNPAPCQEPQDCSCPTILKSDCVNYSGDDLECSGIKQGTILTELIQQLDAFICQVKDDLLNAFSLRNIGAGAKIYKGDDILGRKELRTVESTSDIITVTEATNTIQIGIDEDELNQNINIVNVGEGVEVYKGYNGTSNEHEFRTVVQEDQGVGESFLRDIQQTTDELKVRVKTLVSDNLTITATDEEVRIETPMTASIPALYVNDLYVPTYQEWLSENSAQNGGVPVAGFEFIGKGTLAQPFTDTIVYTLNAPLTAPVITSNTSIQNSLDGDTIYSYVGSGSRLSPDKTGQTIIIQENNTNYTFPGNLEYSSLKLIIDAVVISTNSSYLIDMDNTIDMTDYHVIEIEVLENKRLNIQGEGFKNNGTTTATNNFTQRRQIKLVGSGVIGFYGSDLTKYLITSDKDSVGNTTIGFNNDGSWQFEIRCYLESEFQGLVAIGGLAKVYSFGGIFQTGTVSSDVNVNLKAFNLKGGFITFRDNSQVIFYGSNTTNRLKGFTLEPTNGFTPELSQDYCNMVGNLVTLYSKENTSNASLQVFNSGSGAIMFTTNIFDSPNLWSVVFKNNSFASGSIDITKADLTSGNVISSVNTIGSNLIETLVSRDDRADAISSGLPLYSAYLKTSGVAYPTTTGWIRDIVLPV